MLEELLKKLKVEHVVWCKDKEDMYYEVKGGIANIFPCICMLFECRNFLSVGDISGARRRAMRELHTLPHRNGYRRENELDSKVIFYRCAEKAALSFHVL